MHNTVTGHKLGGRHVTVQSRGVTQVPSWTTRTVYAHAKGDRHGEYVNNCTSKLYYTANIYCYNARRTSSHATGSNGGLAFVWFYLYRLVYPRNPAHLAILVDSEAKKQRQDWHDQ